MNRTSAAVYGGAAGEGVVCETAAVVHAAAAMTIRYGVFIRRLSCGGHGQRRKTLGAQ
jgi:hypothetical protein